MTPATMSSVLLECNRLGVTLTFDGAATPAKAIVVRLEKRVNGLMMSCLVHIPIPEIEMSTFDQAALVLMRKLRGIERTLAAGDVAAGDD